MVVLGQEPRQTTSNLGHLQKPSIQVTVDQIVLVHYFMLKICAHIAVEFMWYA
jgi:hypothetical protein